MATPPSHLHTFLPDTSRLKLKSFEHPDSGQALIFATTNGVTANCPSCQHLSQSLHSRYWRVLRDLPWQGSSVELRLDVRRFRRRTRECPRVTFGETLPTVARRYGRQTSRLSETVRLIGYVLGGEAGARLFPCSLISCQIVVALWQPSFHLRCRNGWNLLTLRLATGDLREVALAVPGARSSKKGGQCQCEAIRFSSPCFSSRLASIFARYVALKRALGRRFDLVSYALFSGSIPLRPLPKIPGSRLGRVLDMVS